MREIAFRVWDKVAKKMFYVSDTLVIHLDGRIEISDNDTYKQADFVLMQYTGVKDNTGTKIFEGDIINFHSGEFWQGYYEFSGTKIIDMTKYDVLEMLCEMESIEVVGNIYNNAQFCDRVEA